MKSTRKKWFYKSVFSSARVKHPPKTVRHLKPTVQDDDRLYCNKYYIHCDDSQQLINHEQQCFLSRRYPCTWLGCNHGNSQKSQMQQHYHSVHLKKPFRCRICGELCIYKKSHDKHEKLHHAKVHEQPSDNEDISNIEKGVHNSKMGDSYPV